MKTYELLITDNIFCELRENFNAVMKKTLFTMQSKGSDSGKINLELKIFLNHDVLELGSGIFGKETREYVNPAFEHKVTSTIQIKDEKTGKIDGKYELVSADGSYFIKEIENPQRSLFDAETDI